MGEKIRQFIFFGGIIGGLALGVIFLLPIENARAAGCCQILTSSGTACQDIDVSTFCACDKIGSDCVETEYSASASCNKTKKVCELPKGGSAGSGAGSSSSGGSSGSSKSSGSSSATKSSSPAPAPSAPKPKTEAWGGPTNLGNPKGTPKPGGSVFLPECATDEGQGPGHGCRDVGAFISLFVNYANGSLAIIGAVAFLFFIYGGVMLLISGGEAERVKKGRDAIMGAIIGLLIVFGAQMLVRFVIQGLVPAEYQDSKNLLQIKLPDSTEKK